jgi:hypothetical protein
LKSVPEQRCPFERGEKCFTQLPFRLFAHVSILCLTLLGCLPFPHFETRLPHVTGSVIKDHRPLANVELRLSDLWQDTNCRTPARMTTTDKNGNFELDAVSTFRLIKPLLGDPIFGWTLCIVVDGKAYTGASAGGIGYAPASIAVFCNLDRNGESLNSGPESKYSQLCSVAIKGNI